MLIDFARCFDPEAVITLSDQAKMVLHKTTTDPLAKQWKRASGGLQRQLIQLLHEKEVGIWNILKKPKEQKTKDQMQALEEV